MLEFLADLALGVQRSPKVIGTAAISARDSRGGAAGLYLSAHVPTLYPLMSY